LTIGLVGIGLVAASIQIYATDWGIGVSADSRWYIEAARRLYSTGSLTVTYWGTPAALVHFPPLLSIILAGARLVSKDPEHAARWLNSILLVATVVISGLLIYNLSSRSRLLSLAGTLLVAGLNPVFMLYLWAWSEPLFIFLLLAGFLFLWQYTRELAPWLLGLAGLCVGLALASIWLPAVASGPHAAVRGGRRLPHWALDAAQPPAHRATWRPPDCISSDCSREP
jgi:hypothetical protein